MTLLNRGKKVKEKEWQYLAFTLVNKVLEIEQKGGVIAYKTYSNQNKEKLSIFCELQIFGIYIPFSRLYIYIYIYICTNG